MTDTKVFAPYVQLVGKVVATTLFLEKQKNVSVEVYLLTNESIREINKKFRKKDVATNVLSFENSKDLIFSEKLGRTNKKHIGEIYLAPRYIKSKKEDIRGLSLHGTLHLLGYDHKKQADYKKMEKREEKIFARIKLGK
ncbi:MAG: rRNA maturation RNase YbeY [Patescibacteria group bacterium]